MDSIQDPLHVSAAQGSHSLGFRVQGWGFMLKHGKFNQQILTRADTHVSETSTPC